MTLNQCACSGSKRAWSGSRFSSSSMAGWSLRWGGRTVGWGEETCCVRLRRPKPWANCVCLPCATCASPSSALPVGKASEQAVRQRHAQPPWRRVSNPPSRQARRGSCCGSSSRTSAVHREDQRTRARMGARLLLSSGVLWRVVQLGSTWVGAGRAEAALCGCEATQVLRSSVPSSKRTHAYPGLVCIPLECQSIDKYCIY